MRAVKIAGWLIAGASVALAVASVRHGRHDAPREEPRASEDASAATSVEAVQDAPPPPSLARVTRINQAIKERVARLQALRQAQADLEQAQANAEATRAVFNARITSVVDWEKLTPSEVQRIEEANAAEQRASDELRRQIEAIKEAPSPLEEGKT